MASVTLGKVAPTPKGEWNGTLEYEKLDIVTHEGSSYIAISDVPSGTLINNNQYWELMVAKGTPNITIGTVTTVSASTGADATLTGDADNPVLNLQIPRGVSGNESIDDTKGDGDTDYVWSADKSFDEITNLKSTIENSTNNVLSNYRLPSHSGTGVSWIVEGDTITITGTTSADTAHLYFLESNSIPSYFEKNVPYLVQFAGENLDLRVYFLYPNDISVTALITKANAIFVIPDDVIGLGIRLFATRNKTYNESVQPIIGKIDNVTLNSVYKTFKFDFQIGRYANTGVERFSGNTSAISKGYYYAKRGSTLAYKNLFSNTYALLYEKPEDNSYIKVVTLSNTNLSYYPIEQDCYIKIAVSKTEDFTEEDLLLESENIILHTLGENIPINDDIIDNTKLWSSYKLSKLNEAVNPNKYLTKIFNGVPNNVANIYGVCTDFISAKSGDIFEIKVNRPLDEGCYYVYSFSTFDKNKLIITSELYDATKTDPIRVAGNVRTAYIRFGVVEYDSTGNQVALRGSNYQDYDIIVTRINDIIENNTDVIPKIIQSRKTLGTNSILTLLHFSDIHGSAYCYRRVSEFYQHNKDIIDNAICTGDILSSRFASDFTFWTDPTILTCIGNHDGLAPEEGWAWSQVVSQTDMYNKFIEPFYSNWGENVSIVTNHTYYYKDYLDCGIRLIVLDTNIRDTTENTAQLTWFTNVLSDAQTNNKAVVIAQHFPPVNQIKIDTTFTDKNRVVSTSEIASYAWNTYRTSYMDAVENFIENNGIFLCWLCGHTHCDFISYEQGYPRQLFLTVTTAQLQDVNQSAIRSKTDKSMDAFNVVSFDSEQRLVKVIRVGQDRDYLLRHLDTITIDVSSTPFTLYES